MSSLRKVQHNSAQSAKTNINKCYFLICQKNLQFHYCNTVIYSILFIISGSFEAPIKYNSLLLNSIRIQNHPCSNIMLARGSFQLEKTQIQHHKWLHTMAACEGIPEVCFDPLMYAAVEYHQL